MKKNSLLNSEEFFAAVNEGNIQKVASFLEAGIDSNLKDKYGCTALHYASQDRHLEVVKLLIEKGANINAMDESCTALHYASQGGHLEVVKLLIEKGANINAIDERYKTALIRAQRLREWKIVEFLLKKGANPDSWTVLHRASKKGYLERVRAIIEKGININIKDAVNRTALHYASEEGHLEIVKFLIEKGAKINVKDQWNETPLHYTSKNGHLEVVKFLIKQKANINTKNDEGETPLDIAKKYSNNKKLIEFLKNK